MLFFGKTWKHKRDTKKFLGKVSNIVKLTDTINKKNKELESFEYELILENQDDVYMSLKSFLSLMKEDELTMTKIMEKCKHINDLKTTDVAFLEIHAIPDDTNHIILCPDIKNCDIHKEYKGDPIRITSIRRK